MFFHPPIAPFGVFAPLPMKIAPKGVISLTLRNTGIHVNILKFVAGHGAVFQPTSINIVFGYK